MCHDRDRGGERAARGALDDATIRLASPGRRCGAFPWWTLWLIWPLTSAAIHASSSLAIDGAALARLAGSMAAVAQLGVGVALVLIGAALLWRDRFAERKEHPYD